MNKKFPVNKTEAEWKAELSPEAYYVLRQKGTERPHTGEFDLHFKNGDYHCKACNAKLFESEHKFESGCGWPSFDEAVEGAIEYIFGFNLLRDYEGTSLDTLRHMIGIGMGMSFLPSLYIRSEITHRKDVAVLDLGFTLPKREIAIAWRPNSSEEKLYNSISDIIYSVCKEKLSDYIDISI